MSLYDYSDYIKLVRNYDLIYRNEALDHYLNDGGFFTAPASTKYHGAYAGGLCDHSIAVTKRLLWMTDKLGLKWMRDESPVIVGLFHDLCKCDQYVEKTRFGQLVSADGTTITSPLTEKYYDYNTNTLLKGHGAKSVMILSQFMTLTEEEMLCIRYHMGPYEKEEWDQFDMAIKKFENCFWVHAADMMASKRDDT